MKKGILVVNAFLNAGKYIEIYEWLSKAAAKCSIELTIKTNAEYLVRSDNRTIFPETPECDFVLFWDKDVNLAKAFESAGIPVFNSADAIACCDNKALTFDRLAGKIRMPKTFRIPMTFPAIGYPTYDFLDAIEKELGFPYIIKECCGSFGAQVYLINNRNDAVNTLIKAGGRECIAQEFISSSIGRDIRIHTVGDKVITSMIRYNENDFRANVTNGGSMQYYEPNNVQTKMALDAAKILKLDFAGIDLLFGDNDEPILCEVNSNAHFRNIYDCTKVNVADAILNHINNCI